MGLRIKAEDRGSYCRCALVSEVRAGVGISGCSKVFQAIDSWGFEGMCGYRSVLMVTELQW